MSNAAFDSPHNASRELRFDRTLAFLRATLPAPARVLDLGPDNPLAGRMRSLGYDVVNTGLTDLDEHPEVVEGLQADAVTAFEILEHLVSPMPLLRALEPTRLFASIPLRLWFATAYRNPNDRWDQHYHEFEDWQFDWLLEKGGWTNVRTEKWTSPTAINGIRPLLRRFTPRYYVVESRRAG
ncbi:MAG: methyltransferase [Bacteroidota bacterium]